MKTWEARQCFSSSRFAKLDAGGQRPVLNQVFITLLQTETMQRNGQTHSIRCGSVLVIDLDDERVTYVIRKGLHDQERWCEPSRLKRKLPPRHYAQLTLRDLTNRLPLYTAVVCDFWR